jgi:pilus assembly protein TadC
VIGLALACLGAGGLLARPPARPAHRVAVLQALEQPPLSLSRQGPPPGLRFLPILLALAAGLLVALWGGDWLYWSPMVALSAGIASNRAIGRGASGLVPAPDARSLAFSLDLIASAIKSGLPPELAIDAVARCAGHSADRRLRSALEPLSQVGRLICWGADPAQAWLVAGQQPGYEAVAAAAGRCAGSGARLAGALTAAAAQARLVRQNRALARAHRAGIFALLPLGSCFLPAFICLGIVPVVGGLAGQLLSGSFR